MTATLPVYVCSSCKIGDHEACMESRASGGKAWSCECVECSRVEDKT